MYLPIFIVKSILKTELKIHSLIYLCSKKYFNVINGDVNVVNKKNNIFKFTIPKKDYDHINKCMIYFLQIKI
jgi:hypothetical protein